MPVTNECAGLKIAWVCYTIVITESDDDDDSLSNSEPGSEADGGADVGFLTAGCFILAGYCLWLLGGLRCS